MPSIASLNQNGVWVYLSKIEPNRDRTIIGDASPKAALCERDLLGTVIGVDAHPGGGTRLTLAEAADEDTEGYVILDQHFGFYALNGRHAAVTDPGGLTIQLPDLVFAAGWRAEEGSHEVWKVVTGMHDLTLAVEDAAQGLYFTEIPQNRVIARGDRFTLFLWDVGTYAGQYFRKFEVTGS